MEKVKLLFSLVIATALLLVLLLSGWITSVDNTPIQFVFRVGDTTIAGNAIVQITYVLLWVGVGYRWLRLLFSK